MASKAEVICLLFLFATEFFAIGSATYCTYDRDCNTWSRESCCSDGVCRQSCYYCFYNYQCGTGELCCDSGDCLSVCTTKKPTTIPGNTDGGVLAAVITTSMVFLAVAISIVACYCCACCPCYRHRSPGTVIVSQPANQPYVTTMQTSTSIQQMQQYPPLGNYSQPPPDYGQPPPPYPSYPQQPAQYPPPQAQGQPPMPPQVGVAEPVKY